MRNGFVNLDDPDYVTRNPHVLAGLTWSDIRWALGSSYPSSNWHPLTWISHMADVQLYGRNPAGHHFTSVLLHILAVVLLFLLIESATGRALRSAAVAALFAVQPLNVEAVAWISERKSVLCVLVLFTRNWSIRLVREKARRRALSVGRFVFRFGNHGEGHGNSLPVCIVAAGLLAAGTTARDRCKWKAATVFRSVARAGNRKDSAIRDGGSGRSRHRLCALSRTCADGDDAV